MIECNERNEARHFLRESPKTIDVPTRTAGAPVARLIEGVHGITSRSEMHRHRVVPAAMLPIAVNQNHHARGLGRQPNPSIALPRARQFNLGLFAPDFRMRDLVAHEVLASRTR